MYADEQLAGENIAFFCNTCGEIWGRVLMHPNLPWFTRHAPCVKHTTQYAIGGSFISPWRHHFAELPPEVLNHEIVIRCDQFLKEHPHEQIQSAHQP
ncbi:hypothetical protein [Bacteriophage sp.]|nr:hypothetical protein [Bacteriophage sp.]